MPAKLSRKPPQIGAGPVEGLQILRSTSSGQIAYFAISSSLSFFQPPPNFPTSQLTSAFCLLTSDLLSYRQTPSPPSGAAGPVPQPSTTIVAAWNPGRPAGGGSSQPMVAPRAARMAASGIVARLMRPRNSAA